jgi:hypothetical protein
MGVIVVLFAMFVHDGIEGGSETAVLVDPEE